MNPIRCIIIEDEPLAAEIMQDYIRNIPQLKLIGVFPDALFGMDFLSKNPVDLIFLDLHLPKLKGFDFLKTLKNPPKVIVTTAYHQYAVESYELDIVDYLLKPIEFSRLLQAVNKIQNIPEKTESLKNDITTNSKEYLFFNVNKKKVKVFLEDINYVESLKEYVKIHFKDSYIITQHQIGEMEKILHQVQLLRIHRSYLVVKNKIDAYSASTIEVRGKELPIGRTYKKWVMEELSENL